MSDRRIDPTISALLSASLIAWGIKGRVWAGPDGKIELDVSGQLACVEAPTPGLPFRYVLVIADRTRGLMSIAALLRAVRTLGDPDYRVAKLRIAPLPVIPP